jgi:hypothetical protein
MAFLTLDTADRLWLTGWSVPPPSAIDHNQQP